MPLSEDRLHTSLEHQPELREFILSRPELFAWLDSPDVLPILAYAYENMVHETRHELATLSDGYALRDRLFETYLERRYEHKEQNPEINAQWPLACFEELLSAFAVQEAFWDYSQSSHPRIDYENEWGDWRSHPADPPKKFSQTALKLDLWIMDDRKQPRHRCAHKALRDFFVYRVGVRILQEGRAFMAVLQEYREFVREDLAVFLPPLMSTHGNDLIAALFRSGDPRVVNLIRSALFNRTSSDKEYIIKALEALDTPEAAGVIRQWSEQGRTKPTLRDVE